MRELIQDKIQEEIVLEYKTNPYFIIEAGTGSGKGKAVIKCIDSFNSPKKWLILVPEIQQIENFKNEFRKFGFEYLLENKVEDIICYASFKNYKNGDLNIVLNEVQSLSEERFNILKTINTDSIIADSATIPTDVKERLYNLKNEWYIYHLPLREGIEIGLLPKPRIYSIPILLSNDKSNYEWKQYGKKKKGLAKEYYEWLCKSISYWKDKWEKDKQPWQKNKMMSVASERKRLVAKVKTNKAKELIDQFEKENKKYIVFSGSVEQAEYLGGNSCVHSKRPKKHNTKIIKDFNMNITNKLFSVGMLVSGMTLSGLDTGLIIQLDKGENNDSLKAIQMCGRIMRSKEPEIYILYCPDTMDMEYYNNFIEAIGTDFLI